MVGYSLGSKDAEDEIEVLREAEDNIITCSKSLNIDLNINSNSILCQHKLVVPYSIINIAKKAREANVREVIFNADKLAAEESNVKMTLNLWGFDSFIDYIFTVCELVFLEGLIPVLNINNIELKELKKICNIIGALAIPLDIQSNNQAPISQEQLKLIEWSGKLNLPIILHLDISSVKIPVIKNLFKTLIPIQEEYEHIHECIIYHENPFKAKSQTKIKFNFNQFGQVIQTIQDIVFEKINLSLPIHHYPAHISQILDLNINDFPHIPHDEPKTISGENEFSFELLHKKIYLQEKELISRFPLSFKFIQAGKYSSKLGQVFDSYQYKIKKFMQEKNKGKNK